MAKKPTYEEPELERIRVSGINIEWNTKQGTCTFEKLPVAMMWVDTTLAGLMSGVQAMVGTERFVLALQSEGRKSVEADWRVISQFSDFRQGFQAISNIAAVAGWGGWRLVSLDERNRECRFQVRDSWEGRYQKALGVCWGSGMLAGKMAGYCSKLFETNCWAEQTKFIAQGDEFDEFEVRPSPRSIEEEIENLLATDKATRAHMAVALQKLQKEIAERKRAEEALQESERFARSTLDALMAHICILDDRGTIIATNKAWRDFAAANMPGGRMQRTGEGVNYLAVCDSATGPHSGEAPAFATGISAVMSGEIDHFELEYPCQGPKESHWFVGRVTRFQGAGPTRIVVSHINTTERKAAEEALRESEERLRSIIEHSNELFYIHDTEHNLTYVSPQSKSVLDYTPEELAMKWTELATDNPINQEGVAATERAIETGERQDPYLLELKRKDGIPVLLEIDESPIKDAEGKVAGITGAARDVTERKQAEEALRESEERFRILVEKSPLGVALVGKDGSYKYVNPKFIEIFGYTLEDIPTGRDWFRKAYPDKEYRHQVISTWKTDFKELKAGEVRPRSFNVICKDGPEKVISLRPVMTETGDHLVIYEDISEQKRLEEQLRQAQKLEAIGTLAGGIAHDFNNLLMGIQGRTSLMLMDTDSYHSHFEHLKGLEKYVKSAADLTKQLLGFARGGKYEVKPTDLNEVVRKTSEMFGRTKKEIRIHSSYQKEIWAADVDQGQIEQVLLNLYVNAWQAMPGGGELYLETRNVTLDEEYVQPHQIVPGRYVKISVTDSGMGMDKRTQERLFDPFFTTKEMGRGTGLGLASAYGIIKHHDGIINVYSEKGQGSTFNIYLPASGREIAKRRALPEEIVMGTETILLVDDEDMIIDVGKEMMEGLGYEVLVARSGKEALEVYQENRNKINMVVLDMIMPEMGGGDIYDRLKEVYPDIKVLLSSGYSINGQAEEILARGCDGFIQKPYNLVDLSRKLREVLDKKK